MRIKSFIPRGIKEYIDYIKTCKRYDDSVSIAKNSKVYPDVKIGKYSYINGNSVIFSGSVGRYCSIGYNVQIGPPEHPKHNFSTHPIFYCIGGYSEIISPPIIESDVWIGSNVVILQGVKIGVGAIIAAGAIVTKDVPPYAIVAGIPARIIKFRFDDKMISKLVDSKWWQLEPNEIADLNIVREFLEKS